MKVLSFEPMTCIYDANLACLSLFWYVHTSLHVVQNIFTLSLTTNRTSILPCWGRLLLFCNPRPHGRRYRFYVPWVAWRRMIPVCWSRTKRRICSVRQPFQIFFVLFVEFVPPARANPPLNGRWRSNCFFWDVVSSPCSLPQVSK